MSTALMLQALSQLITRTRGDRQCFVIVLIPEDAFCTIDDIYHSLPAPEPIAERHPEDCTLFPADKMPTASLTSVRDKYDHRDIDSSVPVLFLDPNVDNGITAAAHIASFAVDFKPVEVVSVTSDGFYLTKEW